LAASGPGPTHDRHVRVVGRGALTEGADGQTEIAGTLRQFGGAAT